MLFKNITILDEDLAVREHCWVGIQDDRIAYIGTEEPEGAFGEVYDGAGKLLMSGFFNAHAHSPMALLRGYGENLTLQDWLNERVLPFENHLNGEAAYWATLLSAAESLRFGIVSSSDAYYFHNDMARAILDSGMKNNLARAIVAFGDDTMENSYRVREAKELYDNYNGAGDGRLRVDFSIHAEYTITPEVAAGVADLAAARGTGMQIHLSETKREHERCKEWHGGKTPTQVLDSAGIFDVPVTAAHCVWLEETDMDILAEKGTTAVSCPASNLKLASGVCNAPLMMKKGIQIALGTDSVASNNNLNFIEEIKLYALVQKGKWMDPTAITPQEALFSATRAGALSQGRKDTGVLREGYKADLIVLDLEGPHMCPVHDLRNSLVYSASGSDVVMTMVDGNVLYRDGQWPTIDIEKAKAEATRSTQRILRELAK